MSTSTIYGEHSSHRVELLILPCSVKISRFKSSQKMPKLTSRKGSIPKERPTGEGQSWEQAQQQLSTTQDTSCVSKTSTSPNVTSWRVTISNSMHSLTVSVSSSRTKSLLNSTVRTSSRRTWRYYQREWRSWSGQGLVKDTPGRARPQSHLSRGERRDIRDTRQANLIWYTALPMLSGHNVRQIQLASARKAVMRWDFTVISSKRNITRQRDRLQTTRLRPPIPIVWPLSYTQRSGQLIRTENRGQTLDHLWGLSRFTCLQPNLLRDHSTTVVMSQEE